MTPSKSTPLGQVKKLADSRVVKRFRTSFWGFADQSLMSASNFLIMLILARELGPNAFGTFILGYTALLFVNGFQSALITQPHNVIGAGMKGADYVIYTTSSAAMQIGFSLLVGLILLVAGLILHGRGFVVGQLLILISPTSIAWQSQEFVRRVLYTQSDYNSAFLNDLVSYGGQALAIVFLWRADSLTSTSGIITIGITSAAGSLFGIWQLRASLTTRLNTRSLWLSTQKNWIYGRWMLGTSLAWWLSNQLYPLLTAGFVGVAAMGGLRAAQTLFGPTNILLRGFETMLPSKSARVYESGNKPALLNYIKSVMIPAAIMMGLFCIIVSAFSTQIVKLFLGDEYASFAWLLSAYAIYYFLSLFISFGSIVLKSMRSTGPLFFSQMVSATFTLTVGILVVRKFGLEGAIAGLIAGALLVSLLLWSAIVYERGMFFRNKGSQT